MVHAPKKEIGVDFGDLSMLTRFLPKKEWSPLEKEAPKPLIQVVSSVDHMEEESVQDDVKMDTDSSLLHLEPEHMELKLDGQIKYGFNNQYARFFKCWHGQIGDIIQLPTPDTTLESERSQLREQHENVSFDMDRYILDYLHVDEDMLYQAACSFVPKWKNKKPVRLSTIQEQDTIENAMDTLSLSDAFTDTENEILRRLPNREYLLDASERARIAYGLVDILLAYCYDHRITMDDPNIESAWTISVLSPTLAWLDTSASNMDTVLRSAVRRMLCFPYIRHYQFSKSIVQDCLALLRCDGKRGVLKAMLSVYTIFEHSDLQYLLCTLYLEHYCTWIQHEEDSMFNILANELEAALNHLNQQHMGWSLAELESIAKEDMEENSTDSSEYESSSEYERSSDEDSE